jgi:hypothetical protein
MRRVKSGANLHGTHPVSAVHPGYYYRFQPDWLRILCRLVDDGSSGDHHVPKTDQSEAQPMVPRNELPRLTLIGYLPTGLRS